MDAPAPARPTRAARAFLSAVVIAVPPLIILSLIAKLAVNVPFQDDWDTVSVLINWRHGTLGFADFWAQQSEHRILVVRLLIWLSGVLTDFNVVAEMFLGFGFVVFTLLIIRDLLNIALRDDAPQLLWPLTLASSLVLFSLTLQENWFFGTASLELLFYPASVGLIWALTRWPDRSRGLLIAFCCAVVGMFTEASGFGLWIVGALAIWLMGDPNGLRSRRLTLWALAATLTAVAYIWGLHWGGSAVQGAVSSPQRFVLFVGTCLGLPFAYGSTPTWSATVGFIGCAALVSSASYIRKERPGVFQSLRPVLLLAVLGLLTSALIGFGRSNLEPRFAMASHYAIGSSLFWIATIVVTTMAAQTAWETETDRTGKAARLAAAAAALWLLSGYITGNVQGYADAYERSRNLEMALASLYLEGDVSRDVSQFLYPPDDGRFHRQMVELKSFKLGPFARRMEPAKALAVEQFSGRMASAGAKGFHDGGDCDSTFGWAWDPARPDVPIMVDIWYRGARLGTARANWFRADLRKAGMGNGQHAFLYFFPTMLEVGTGETITVTFAGTTKSVGGSPKVITCE